MTFDLAVVADHAGEILDGFLVTLWTWAVGVVLGGLLGFLLALVMRGGGPLARGLVRGFVELFRGTPFLVQLFILYYGGPAFGLVLEPLGAGLLGLTLYGSAYFAEIFRAGFAAGPRGQVEAAAILGLSRGRILTGIVLPQMLVVVLPALVNLVIILTKETAVLSIVTIPELTFVVRGIGNATFAYFETTLVLALIYWALVEITAAAGRWAERRVGRFVARPA